MFFPLLCKERETGQKHLTTGISDQENLEKVRLFPQKFLSPREITTDPLEEKEQYNLDTIEFRNGEKLKDSFFTTKGALSGTYPLRGFWKPEFLMSSI